MPKLTALQACQETHDLWTQIAREAEKGHYKRKDKIPGPWQRYKNYCPCCQYVQHMESPPSIEPDCSKCPMRQEWKSFPAIIEDGGYYCETHITPYLKWSGELNHHYSCYDLAFLAYLIADLALEAIERIKKEERTTS